MNFQVVSGKMWKVNSMENIVVEITNLGEGQKGRKLDWSGLINQEKTGDQRIRVVVIRK